MKKLSLLLTAIITFGVVMAQQVPSNWTVATTEISVSEETTTVSEGASALSVTWTSQDNQDIESEVFSVTSDASFSYTLDVYDNDAAGRIRMVIVWDTGNDYQNIYSEDMDSWQTLTYSGTVPTGATTAQIRLRFYDVSASWAGSASILVDNVSFIENGGSNLVVNGGFESWQEPAPALTINTPANGATVNTADVDVTFTVENFELGTDGKVKYSLDGGADVFVTTTDAIALTSLTEASHTVNMELVDMSDASLDPAVTATTTFTVDLGAPSYTPVYDIQYTTETSGDSPLATQTVTTKGVVSAVDGTNFWIQDGAGSWNGLYVYSSITPAPVQGDSVMVTGTIAEYYNLTEVSPTSDVTNLNSGNVVADPTVLTTATAGAEEYEGVLVTVTGVCSNADAGNGMFEINDGSGTLLIDDVMYAYTPTLGHSYTITGIVHYTYSEWKILPRSASDVVDNGASLDPMLSITSPEAGATVYNANISVEFTVDNFVLGTDGQVAWNLDGGTTAYVTASPIAVTGLADGSHTVNLELVDMSNNSLSTPVTASVTFTVDLSGPTYTSIYDIQNGTATGDVWVRAVVSASFNNSDYGEGYYLQQGGGAWNGIYVYDLVNTPAIGDSVEIAASIDEYYDMTQLETITSYSVVAIEGTVAAPTEVSTLAAASEEYESVLVKVVNATCDTIQNQYGEWYVNDGSGPLMCKDNGAFDFTETLGTNYNIIGVMAYSYGEFSINYRIASDITISSDIESELVQNVSVYPNPAAEVVNIAADGAQTITITNMVGQVVKEVSVANAIETINISGFNAGIYFVEITKDNDTAVVKLVVE